MKLYHANGTCSQSPHIVLREAGLDFELVKVDLRTHKLADGRDYNAINPKGYVPALELDDGRVLTEGPAIVQYIADRNPDSGLAPKWGTFERYQLLEWLNFVSTEIHKSFSPLFKPNTPEEWKNAWREKLAGRFDWLARELTDRQYLMGARFTAVDAYLFTVLGWAKPMGLDLARWPVLNAYVERIAARPKVREALEAQSKLK